MCRRWFGLFALLGAVGCDAASERPAAVDVQQSVGSAKAEPQARRGESLASGAGAELEAVPAPTDLADPNVGGPAASATEPTFDPAAATEATVRVTKIVDVGGPPCGVLHSVGAIEVEVLGVGEPPPPLGLYVSCPADLQPKGMLEVGRVLRSTMHVRKQPWPKPARRLDPALTVRYAKTLTPVDPP